MIVSDPECLKNTQPAKPQKPQDGVFGVTDPTKTTGLEKDLKRLVLASRHEVDGYLHMSERERGPEGIVKDLKDRTNDC